MSAAKVCTACGTTQTLDSFYKFAGSADGHMYWCKSCHKARVEARRLRLRPHVPDDCGNLPSKKYLSDAETLDRYSTPVPVCGCRLWTKAVTPFGYGQFRKDGRTRLAHRVAYELAHGDIPAGLYVLHKCDVPQCVNPEHLFVGTPSDNMRDKEWKRRGNHARGSNVGAAKLTDCTAVSIRQSSLPAKEAAAAFNVSVSTVYNVRRGITWTHV